MTALRPYQERAIADLRATYAAGRRAPCLVLPTGAGKTVVASTIIRSAVARGQRCLFLAHRRELIDQSVAKLEACGVTNVRMIRAQHDVGDPTAPVTVASVPTLTNWMDRLPLADLVLFDECHHTKAETWKRLADAYARARLLGLTATPQRGDGAPLGDIFDSLVVGATVRELMALEHLVGCRVWAPPMTLDTAEMALDVVGAYQKHASGKRAVVFCASVEHATTVAGELAAAGIAAGMVHGTGSAQARTETLARFRAGELRVITNVHVLTEGWDDPGVEVCILARKPVHVGTFLQMAGRVLRPAPGKTGALLIDLCGSVHDHGTPDMDREFSLDGKAISGVKRDPIRQCPHCGSVFLSTSECPTCGAELGAGPRALPASIGVGVVEVTGPIAPRPQPTVLIASKYPGTCYACSKPYAVGDRIAWTKGAKSRHAHCGINDAMDAADALLSGAA
jgi:DNA repair protein RadD